MNFANYDSKKIYNKDELLAMKKPFADYTSSKKEIKEEDIIESKPVLTNSIDNTHYLSVVEDKFNKHLNNGEHAELSKSNLKKFIQANDYITQFYIGSLSAVGLYILYRYLYVRK